MRRRVRKALLAFYMCSVWFLKQITQTFPDIISLYWLWKKSVLLGCKKKQAGWGRICWTTKTKIYIFFLSDKMFYKMKREISDLYLPLQQKIFFVLFQWSESSLSCSHIYFRYPSKNLNFSHNISLSWIASYCGGCGLQILSNQYVSLMNISENGNVRFKYLGWSSKISFFVVSQCLKAVENEKTH